jgi:queuine tRNA-ribosyltransferase
MERSLRWLARCRVAFERLRTDDPHAPTPEQALFPIVQGGIHAELRRESARAVVDAGDWRGIGIGGLSVGESKPDMYGMLEVVDAVLPTDRPRYLMGVGYPEDLVEGVRRGVDLFDCVAPTRMGRNGAALTRDGRINLRNARWARGRGPAGRRLRLRDLPPLLARLPPPPGGRGRDARAAAAQPAQRALPGRADGARPGDAGRRDVRRLERAWLERYLAGERARGAVARPVAPHPRR